MLPWTPPELANLLNALTHKGEALFYDQENQRYVLTATTRALEEESRQTLKSYHQENPLKPGLSKEELRRKLPPQMEVRLFNEILGSLTRQKQVVLEKDLVRLTTHKVKLAVDQEETSQRLEALYRQGQLSPPTLKEVRGRPEPAVKSNPAPAPGPGEPGQPGQGERRPLFPPARPWPPSRSSWWIS